MGLRNMFGDVALEETQKEIGLVNGDVLKAILIELKIMNTHLEALSGESVRHHEIEDVEYDS